MKSLRSRCCWLIGLLLATMPLSAEGPPQLRRVDVPAERPDLWPAHAGTMVAVPRDEFERLWKAAQPRQVEPPAAILEEAHYEARVAGTTLGPGRCVWRIRRQGPHPVWLDLGSCNIALEDLSWSDRPAFWGADESGKLWLWADAAEGELTATWSATGQRIAGETQFALEFPAAMSSLVRLTTSSGQIVRTDDAPVRGGPSESTTKVWEVALGSRTTCQMSVTESKSEPANPLTIYRRQQYAEIREDQLQFRTTILPEVMDGEIDELRFAVPTPVEVLSVTWGNDFPLTWTRTKGNSTRDQIAVKLPDRLSGELRPIRIEGVVSRRSGGSIAIPDVELSDAVFRSGEILVTVSRPLQVVAVRATGCRQQAPIISGNEGETYNFHQSRTESLLTFEVRQPRSTLAAHVLSAVTVRDEEWTQQSEVVWRSASGTAFQLAMRLPAGWEVTDVDAFSESGQLERISWERLTEPDGSTRLAIELLEALRPDAPRRLSIWSRRRPIDEGQPFESPAARPLDCQTVETVVAFHTASQYWLNASETSHWKTMEGPDLSAPWNQMPLWSALTSDVNAADAWFRSDRPDETGQFQLDRRPQPVTADVTVLAESSEGVLSESFQLSIRPEDSSASERLIVYVSQPGPDIAWQVTSPPNVQLISQRLTGDRRPWRELPAGGELWELRLPPVPADRILIRGERVQPLSLPVRVGLVHLPQATSATSKVIVASRDSSSWQPAAHRMEDVPEATITTESTTAVTQRWEWRYADRAAALSLVSRQHGLMEAPCVSFLNLRSLIAANRDAYDYHRADCVLPALERPVRLHLPDNAELLVAMLDGVRQTAGREGEIVIAPRGDQQRQLQLLYRTLHRSGFLRDRGTVAMPLSKDIVWTGVRWEFFVPPDARLADEPAGVRLEQPLPQRNWWTRLFGPLGRRPSQTFFVPWSLSGWRDLTMTSSTPAASAPLSADATLLSPPMDWQGYVAFSRVPTDIQLVTWQAGRLRILAWMGVLLTFAIAILLRLTGWKLRDHATAVWLAVLGGCALTWDGPSSELIGGVIAGSVMGLLVPRRWLGIPWFAGTPAVPIGSTQSFRLPIKPMTTGLILLPILIVADGPVAQEAAWQPETTVLVPVDADGRPSQKVPLVYLHPRTLEQLRAAVEPEAVPPAWLVQSADYAITSTTGPRWPMTATLRVVICDARPSVTLPLRMMGASLAGPQSCLVDGVPAAATIHPQTGDLQVTWTRDEPPVSAIGHDQPAVRTIALQLQSPRLRAVSESVLALPIPWSPVSRWTVSPSMSADTPASRSIGPRPVLEVAANDASEVTIPVATADITVTEAWEVSATLIDAHTRSVIQPRNGALQRLIVDLPADAALSRVRIRPEGRLQRLAPQSTSRPAVIEFAAPLAEPATIELDYAVPHQGTDGEFTARGLLWRMPRTRAILPQSRYWAVAVLPDIRVEPQSLENSGLVPVSRASVQESLTGLIGDRTPQAIYQVQGDAAVPFRWSTLSSRRQLLLWQQTGTLERDRLRWELEGELEVAGAPVYSHVLSIDRRLRVESVSVRERGAERLLRWSETRFTGSPGTNRITLFLTDPCTETQRITLTASASIAAYAPLALPNVRCEDAELRGGRLLLSAPADTEITWSSTRGLRSLNADNGDAAEPSSGSTWIFDQTEADWRATIRMQPAMQVAAPRMLHMLQVGADDLIQLSTRCQFPWSAPRTSWEWRVPAPWTLTGQPTTQQAVISIEQQPNGDWRVTAVPAGEARMGDSTWQFAARRSALENGTLPLPELTSDSDIPAEIWLVEGTPPPIPPLLAVDAASAQPADWASRWFQELSPMPASSPQWQRVAPQQSSLALRQMGSEPTVSITWLEHRLWRLADGGVTATSLLRTAAPCPVLTVRLPAHCRFQAASADGDDAVTTSIDDGLRIARTDGVPFSELYLYWDQPADLIAAPLVLSQVQWPEFPGSFVDQQAVTVFPAPAEALRFRGGWQRSDWVDRALLRLETLSDQFAADPSPPASRHLQREFADGYSLLADKLGRQPEVLQRGGSPRVTRWQAIVATLNRLRDLRPRDPEEPHLVTVADRLVDHPAALSGMVAADATSQAAWRIDREWARWLIRCVVVLLMLPVLRLLIRREWSEWLTSHPHAATALLGLVWWICLAPSIVGFALIVFAIVRAVSAPRPFGDPLSSGSLT